MNWMLMLAGSCARIFSAHSRDTEACPFLQKCGASDAPGALWIEQTVCTVWVQERENNALTLPPPPPHLPSTLYFVDLL